MIRQSTVFILGAGASVPYGFPSGMKLLRDAKNSPHHHIANVVGDHVGVAQVAALHEALRDCQNE